VFFRYVEAVPDNLRLGIARQRYPVSSVHAVIRAAMMILDLGGVLVNRAGQGFARPATPRLVSDSRASAAQLNAKHSSMQKLV
jgi:hypothetical protein